MPGEKGPAQQDGASLCRAAAWLIGDVPADGAQLSQEGLDSQQHEEPSVCQFTAKCFQHGHEPQAAILQKHLADWLTTCSSIGAAINLPNNGKDIACKAQPLAALQALEQMPRRSTLAENPGLFSFSQKVL